MGIGSKLKKLAQKVIPKEVSKAAPVVGVFNPALGAALGAAGGIREGNIGKAALQGLGAFGLGKVAQGLGVPQFGGNLSSGLGSILQKIPGVSQLAGSPVGQGIGAIFDRAEALGGQLGSVLGTTPASAAATSAAVPTGVTPEGDVFFKPEDIKSSVLSDLLTGGGQSILGDVVGGAGEAGDITRGQLLRSLLGFGIGAFESKQAKDEYEDRMARAGFNQTLDELQAQYQDPRVFESTPISYEDGGEVRDPEYEGWKQVYEKNPELAMMTSPKASEYLKKYQKEQEQLNEKANGGIIGFANGGEPAMEMDYRGGGFIPVGAKERADDVPARLSKNEFVMTADAVRAAGGGNVNKGAKKMYSLMNALEAKA
jgi:hypothetical protein